MLGNTESFDDPHWFWSDQYESEVQMAGFAPTWETTILRGSIEERSFCAFLLDASGVVRSSVSLDWKRDVRRSFGLIRNQVAPDPAALADPEVDPEHSPQLECDPPRSYLSGAAGSLARCRRSSAMDVRMGHRLAQLDA